MPSAILPCFAQHDRLVLPRICEGSVLILSSMDGLWKTKDSKSCSLASVRIPMGNQSAT
jgi:hypothetical protein